MSDVVANVATPSNDAYYLTVGDEEVFLFKSSIWKDSPAKIVKTYLQNNSLMVNAHNDQNTSEYGNNVIQESVSKRIKDMKRHQKMLLVFVRDIHVKPLKLIKLFGTVTDQIELHDALIVSDAELCVMHINNEIIWEAVKNPRIHASTFNPSAANAYHAICTMHEFLAQVENHPMRDEMLNDVWDPNHTGFVLVYDNHPNHKKVTHILKLDDEFPSIVMKEILKWESSTSKSEF